ncbi:MAG: phosphonate C-P lyase system protein PhnG [Cypionkella sp.]|uniref:phosphonate C-P lyase system protein PhnG n=1 Tax=Cypionkella sp. TaxID=2811411 RepID=UPI002AB7FE35|nr:phosphonate C-P lyase system protein PhnG [Cypionkella sp.]MDZ4309579.1 phosphonate C-P lyase system protein PhnG [Cypionkella sp.]MDZ4394529.1 phosphonate C-P lyase system protein PhnG [Cypionkella sp.]
MTHTPLEAAPHCAEAFATRKAWMGLLARAKPTRLADLFPEIPAHDLLRAPEIGAVMVRGRIGGTGQPFNLGEMTVTRCALRLGSGAVGHAHVQGRDKGHALRAAVVDALMQTDQAEVMRAAVLAPLQAEEVARRASRAAKAAATKVEFFTLVRGEDQ